MRTNENIAQDLRKIADASMRSDGTDIPLGEQCREAADRLDALIATEALRAAKTRAEKAEAKLDAVSHALAEAEYRPGDHPVIPVRIANCILQVRAILSGTDPAPAVRPSAWARGVMTPSTPHGPAEYDFDMVWGDDQPSGDGWFPLYRQPAPSPDVGEPMRIASLRTDQTGTGE